MRGAAGAVNRRRPPLAALAALAAAEASDRAKSSARCAISTGSASTQWPRAELASPRHQNAAVPA